MQDIETRIKSLLNQFNKNKSERRSAHINSSIKEDLIRLKKKLKTANVHPYHKILLKEKLNHFHNHVNQQRYKLKRINCITANTKERNIITFFKSRSFKQNLEALESTHIFNSND